MANLTREQILARKRGEESVTLSDGGTVSVRGMKHNEAHALRELETIRERDAFMISCGLVDPAMTTEDVMAWFEVPGESGDLQLISSKISQLSGMDEGQGKDATKSVPRRRGRGRA